MMPSHVPATVDQSLFLPDPEPREVRVSVISVDDHVVEPPDTFEGRLPASLADRAPKVVETPEGHQVWEFEGERFTQVGMNAVAGRRPETYSLEPFRFDQMRPGCYDIEARVKDMDVNGVWASVNFPSQITGFCGRVFFAARDRRARPGLHPGLERLALRGVVLGPPRPNRAPRDHLSGRPRHRRRRDPAQRRAGLHVGDPPGATARDRAAGAVGPGPLGSDHARPSWRRTRWCRCTWAARACPRPPRVHPSSNWAPPCSASSPCRPAPSGCGPATPCAIRVSRSP